MVLFVQGHSLSLMKKKTEHLSLVPLSVNVQKKILN